MLNLIRLELVRPFPDETEDDCRIVHTTYELEDTIVTAYQKKGWRLESREEI